MQVLALDASTYSGSVALIRDGVVVADAVAAMRGEHEERLMPAIASVLSEHGVLVDQLDAVACGAGPGSFTSLRIAGCRWRRWPTSRLTRSDGVASPRRAPRTAVSTTPER